MYEKYLIIRKIRLKGREELTTPYDQLFYRTTLFSNYIL